ncbi:MAG: hypothetical protein R3B06_30325 [Kofleriaceae bacterium]
MAAGYRVEAAAPVAVRRDLERLWAANLTLERHPSDKFAWLYLEAPRLPAQVLVLRDDQGGAVGTAGIGVRGIQVGAGLVEAGLLADLAVDKSHRSVGPALALVRAGKAAVDDGYALGYGFPNRLAEGVFKRAGYRVLGAIERYARPLRHASFVDRLEPAMLTSLPAPARAWALDVLRRPAVATLAGAAVDAARLATTGPAALAARRHLRVSTLARPDARFDALWAAARGEFAVVAERTAGFLQWRFPPSPQRTWRCAIDRATGQLGGYAMVELVDGVAHVRDLFGHRAAMLALLDGLPLAAFRAGATSLSMRYLGAPWLRDALIERGLAPRQSPRTIALTIGAALAPAEAALAIDADRWHLTDADEDA